MKKIKGFLREAVLEIQRQPGLTAQQIVGRLLRSGRVQSAAQNPEGSLVATLHKHHRDHGVERRRNGGTYRFYPSNGGTGLSPTVPTEVQRNSGSGDGDILVTLRLPRRVADILDVLVAAGTCRTRDEAANWLIEKGISSARL